MPINVLDKAVFSSITGSSSGGGWIANASVANDQEQVVLGRHVQTLDLLEGGGVWADDWHMSLDGSMIPDRLTWSISMSRIDVEIHTSNYFLDQAGLQGIFFTEQPSPTNPHQMTGLNLGKIVQHIVRDHTNVTIHTPGGWVDISNIDTINSSAVDVFTVHRSNSIWQTLVKIASNERYVCFFDRFDQFWYIPHPQFRTTPLPVVAQFTENNIVGMPVVTYRDDIRVDQVDMYGLTDAGQILHTKYPAAVGTESKVHQVADIRVNSQARLNVLAQREYNYLNRDIDVEITLPGPWGSYLELYDRVAITYIGTDANGVTISWSDKKFWIEEITMQRVGSFGAITRLGLAEESL